MVKQQIQTIEGSNACYQLEDLAVDGTDITRPSTEEESPDGCKHRVALLASYAALEGFFNVSQFYPDDFLLFMTRGTREYTLPLKKSK